MDSRTLFLFVMKCFFSVCSNMYIKKNNNTSTILLYQIFSIIFYFVSCIKVWFSSEKCIKRSCIKDNNRPIINIEQVRDFSKRCLVTVTGTSNRVQSWKVWLEATGSISHSTCFVHSIWKNFFNENPIQWKYLYQELLVIFHSYAFFGRLPKIP